MSTVWSVRLVQGARPNHELKFDALLLPVAVLQHKIAHALKAFVLNLEVLFLFIGEVVLDDGHSWTQHRLQLSLPAIDPVRAC